MKKATIVFTVRCGFCDYEEGTYDKKREAPKSYTCSKCGTAQKTIFEPTVKRTMGHNHNGHELPGGGG